MELIVKKVFEAGVSVTAPGDHPERRRLNGPILSQATLDFTRNVLKQARNSGQLD
jgi:hypothetical protein